MTKQKLEENLKKVIILNEVSKSPNNKLGKLQDALKALSKRSIDQRWKYFIGWIEYKGFSSVEDFKKSFLSLKFKKN